MPRVFSRGDWEPFSKSYGCCDRTYWAWKFTDFPGARFQEAAYALASLYTSPWPDNPFYQNPKALRRAGAVMRYWQSIQCADGSYNEAYPHEHSLAATAFTAFYVGEALSLLAGHLPEEQVRSLRDTLARCGDWLIANDESHGVLSNHLAAAAAAMTVIHLNSNDARHADRARHFLARIFRHQSEEGWYEEYGGADPGYQTHGTFYLARIWQLTGDAQLLESLVKANRFLAHCIHPNGSLGGEYGSRNTEFFFPAAFEILSNVCESGKAIAAFMRDCLRRQAAAGLAAVDAFNLFPMLNNYLFAAANADADLQPAVQLPFQQAGQWDFPRAGLHMRGTQRYYAVLGTSKGGVLKVFGKDGSYYSDCGYWVKLAHGLIATSQTLQLSPPVERDGDEFVVETRFSFLKQKLMSPTLFLAFRLFNLGPGRFRRLGYWVKKCLVAALVTKAKAAPLSLRRRVQFGDDYVRISDAITLDGGDKAVSLGCDDKFSAIHMGSSRYFQWQDMGPSWFEPARPGREIQELNESGRLIIEKNFEL